MTAFKKSFAVAFTALTLSAAVMSSAAEARPRHGYGWGVGAGIVGALAVGGLLAASSRPAYAYGYGEPAYAGYGPVRRCHLVERVNYYGDVVGHRRVCRTYY